MFLSNRLAPMFEMPEVDELLNKVFSGFGGAVHTFPPVNCWSGKDCVYISSELPGVKSETIELTVVGDQLVLKGTCENDEVCSEARLLQEERRTGSFQRSIPLPYRVDADKVEARMRNGVLWIKLPRSERDKAHQIKVN